MNWRSNLPPAELPPTGRRSTTCLTSQNPAPSNQDFRFAAGTPSLGLKEAFKRSSTRCVHLGTLVASCSSNGSLKRSAILSVQSVSGPLMWSLLLDRRRSITEILGLGSISKNSTTPSGCKILLKVSGRNNRLSTCPTTRYESSTY